MSRFIHCDAECRYAEYRCAECRYAECHYAEYRCAECRYAEWHGIMLIVVIVSVVMLNIIMLSFMVHSERKVLFYTKVTYPFHNFKRKMILKMFAYANPVS